jgi:hypothetical protein
MAGLLVRGYELIVIEFKIIFSPLGILENESVIIFTQS